MERKFVAETVTGSFGRHSEKRKGICKANIKPMEKVGLDCKLVNV